MKTNRKGFTLVEIMIVVAIIGILAVIAIPNFIRARRNSMANACIANMKQIQGAAEQWKLAGNAGTPTVDNLVNDGGAGAESFIKKQPFCPITPTANSYSILDNGDVTCSNDDATEHNVNSKINNAVAP